MKKQSLIGYKGFDKDMKCRDFQFEVGKEYVHDGGIGLCEQGFHYCANPLDVLSFYNLTTSKFAIVEARGAVKSDKQKSVTDRLYIKADLDLSAYIKASVAFIWEKASAKKVSNKGAATSGERANSATSGYGAHSATSGSDGIACSVGRKAKAKATLGCWIVLAEWKEGESYTDAKPIGVKSAIVDGKKVKSDVWYKLENGKFIETDDSK